MIDLRKFVLVKKFFHGAAIGEIHFQKFEFLILRKNCKAGLFERDIIIVVQVVDADYIMPLGKKPLRYMKADKAGSARDQYLHSRFSSILMIFLRTLGSLKI